MLNNIKISQTTEEIILNINVIADLEEIFSELKEKLQKLRDYYQNSKMPIRITGRLFTDIEKAQLKDYISLMIPVEINFDEAEDMLGLHAIKKTYASDIEISETKFIRYSLRSGKVEEYAGSLVICGDVNFGAEVIAGGNIMIMGSLRGIAHAGANGNTSAIIAANSIDVTQIRIANKVKEIDQKLGKFPICLIENNELVIKE